MTSRETETSPATARAAEAAGLRSIAELTKALLDAIIRSSATNTHRGDSRSRCSRRGRASPTPRGRAGRPPTASRAWSSGTLPPPAGPPCSSGPGGSPSRTGSSRSGRAAAWRERPSAAPHANELLDDVFGYVRRAGEPPPETRLDDGVLVWERPVNRCEVLLVLQRALGRDLAGDIGFRSSTTGSCSTSRTRRTRAGTRPGGSGCSTRGRSRSGSRAAT